MRQSESADDVSYELREQGETVTDRTDSTELEIASRTCTGYVLLERKG